MRTCISTRALLALLVLPSGFSLACVANASAADAPLSPSAYGVSTLCSTPAPGHAGCLGLRLVAKAPLSVPHARALARAGHGSSSAPSPSAPSPAVEVEQPIEGSLTPSNLLTGYSLSGAPPPGSTQTIGIVDAYDDPTAEADLERFDSQFKLPACTAREGCFRKVNQEGNEAPLPLAEGGWAQEIATDVEMAHGVCPTCHILLVEAESNSDTDLFAAENTAARLGASEISNSWGGEEEPPDSQAFNHPGIVITASSGDNGYLNWLGGPESTDYPASSPHVVAVGGTRLTLSGVGKTWERETVWNDGGELAGVKEGAGAGGGGCSALFTAPPWQQSVSDWPSVGCGTQRGVADVSADADPYTGVAVYDSTENPEGDKGWGVIGGTSVASPIIAAVFALAGGAHGVEYPARTLYENEIKDSASLHDVVAGSNGECSQPFDESTGSSGCSTAEEAEGCHGHAICLAGPGYDGPSGVGTPDGIGAFQPPPAGSGGEGGTPPGGPPAGGAGAQSPLPPSRASSPPTTSAPAATPTTSVLSALALTRRAIIALNRVRPRVSQVGFAYTLSAATRIRVTLAKRVRIRGRTRWKLISRPLATFAVGGRESRQLSGRGALTPGRYQLTLTPARGAAQSIFFQIG